MLFDRRQGARSQLTAVGHELLTFADEMLSRTDRFHQLLEQMKSPPEGVTLTVVSDSDHIKYLLVAAVAAMKKAAPSVHVVIKHEPSRERVMQRVADGRTDLGICRYPAPAEFGHLGTIQERMYLYATPDDPIHAVPEDERIEYLSGVDFATYAEGMRTRELVERWAGKAGVSLRIVLESRGLEAMRTYVVLGLALAILPEFCVTEDTSGLLKPVSVPGLPLVRGAALLAPPGREVSDAARLFLRMLPAKVDETLRPAPRDVARPELSVLPAVSP